MKNLFLVFAKLLGLYQLYMALLGALQLFAMVAMTMGEAPGFASFLLGLAGVLVYLAVSLAIAWVLIAKTEWLAAKVGIHDNEPVVGLDRVPALAVGVCLIGVFLTVQGIPRMIHMLQADWPLWSQAPFAVGLRKMLPSLVQPVLGLILAFKANALARVLAPTNPSP